MSINREKLVELLIEKTGFDRDKVEKQLSELLNRIQKAAEEGKTFEVEGFGTFSMKDDELHFEPSDELETEINHKYAGMDPIELIGAYDSSGETEEEEKEEKETEPEAQTGASEDEAEPQKEEEISEGGDVWGLDEEGEGDGEDEDEEIDEDSNLAKELLKARKEREKEEKERLKREASESAAEEEKSATEDEAVDEESEPEKEERKEPSFTLDTTDTEESEEESPIESAVEELQNEASEEKETEADREPAAESEQIDSSGDEIRDQTDESEGEPEQPEPEPEPEPEAEPSKAKWQPGAELTSEDEKVTEEPKVSPKRPSKKEDKDMVGTVLTIFVIVVAVGLGVWLAYDFGLLGGGSDTPGNQVVTSEPAQPAGNQAAQQQDVSQAGAAQETVPEQPAQADNNQDAEPEPAEDVKDEGTVDVSDNRQAQETQQPVYGLRGEVNEQAGDGYMLVVYSLTNEEKARRMQNELSEEGYRAILNSAIVDGTEFWRVGLGQFSTVKNAQNAATELPEQFRNNYFVKRIK